MQKRTVATQASETQPGAAVRSRGAGNHSPQRAFAERLILGKFKPRAWAVALTLEAYSRLDDAGRRFSTVYHAIIAKKTGQSLPNVRRALRELSTGPAPLYERRGTTGHMRKVRGRNNWELDTRAPVYYWIENLDAYLAARDTARADNVLSYEARVSEQHPERVKLQAAMFTGNLEPAAYEAAILQLDAKARGRLPKAATAQKASRRCLTPQQLKRFTEQLVEGATDYGALVADAGDKGVRQFHALHRHVFGSGDVAGCPTCEEALFQATLQHRAVAGALTSHRLEAVRCGCGVRVVRNDNRGTGLFWEWARGESPETHDCIHEQNRWLKLRNPISG